MCSSFNIVKVAKRCEGKSLMWYSDKGNTWQTAEHSAHSKRGLRVINENIQDTAMQKHGGLHIYSTS